MNKLQKIGSFVLFGLMLTSANAATQTYILDQSNSLPNGINYATVTLSDGADASNSEYVDFLVEVTVAASPYGNNFGMDKFYFNSNNALTVAEANIININPASWGINTNKNAGGGFGFFDFESKGAGNSRTLTLSFSIANVLGDTIADYALGDGEYFSAHIGGFGADGGNSTIVGGSSPVPVPAAVWLMGSALGGLGFMRRKDKKS